MGQAQRTPVGVAGDLFDAGNGARGQEPQDGGAVEGLAPRQAQNESAGLGSGGP